MEGGVAGGIPPYKGGPKARPPKLQWIVVSGMFCWCGRRGTRLLSMRRPSFPVRGMTTRSTAPAMVIRSWWTRVLLLWPSRNGNGNTFLSTKDHEEGQGQHLFIREGPRRAAKKVKGNGRKSNCRTSTAGLFFCSARAEGLPLQLESSAVHSSPQRTKRSCSSAVAVLRGPSRPFVDKGFDLAVAVLRGPSRPFVDKDFAVAVAVRRGPSWTKGVRQQASAVVDSGVERSCRACG